MNIETNSTEQSDLELNQNQTQTQHLVKKRYLRFLMHGNRTREVTILTNKGVEKLPRVEFPKQVPENISVYEIVLKEGVSDDWLDSYFLGNSGAEEVSQEEIDKYQNLEYYREREEEFLEEKNLKVKKK